MDLVCPIHPEYSGRFKHKPRKQEHIDAGCICTQVHQSKLLPRHRMTGTPTYNAWSNMKSRCTNPNLPNSKNYCNRGIKYDPSWESFEQFFMDMGEKPPNTHLDRIDNDKGYSKDNCRWASYRVSAMNRRFKRTSLPVGVRINRAGNYAARATVKKIEYAIGTFASLDEAVQARKDWLKKNVD